MKSSFDLSSFWQRHKALLYGICAYLATAFALFPTPWLFFPFFLLLFSSQKKHVGWVFLIALSVYSTTLIRVQLPPSSFQSAEGKALVSFDRIKLLRRPFSQGWLYLGTIKTFLPEDQNQTSFNNVPFSLYLPNKGGKPRPLADASYWIKGSLQQTNNASFRLIPEKGSSWHLVSTQATWAEKRYLAKKSLAKTINQRISDSKTAHFLAGIATGEFSDRELLRDFRRYGLQHILAISGFHFSLVACFLSAFFYSSLRRKSATCLVLLLLTAYLFFLGISPSIFRAWVMAALFFFSKLISAKSNALNSLGVALLALVLYDPCMIQSLSFLFSFSVTAAILLFHPLFEQLLRSFFAKRPLDHVMQMDRFDQHGYLIVSTLRHALALLLSVLVISLPLTLSFFQTFPVLSVVYNLFFPFLISISIFLLLLSLALYPLHSILDSLNTWYTSSVLAMTHNLPPRFDLTIESGAIEMPLLIVSISLLFFLGMVWSTFASKRKDLSKGLAFM